MDNDKDIENDKDWNELIERHLHDELNEEEMERLAEKLDSDSSCRRSFVEQVQWHARLTGVLRETQADPDSILALTQPRTGRNRLTEQLATKRTVGILLSLVACLLLALCSRWLIPIQPKAVTVAAITGTSGGLLWTGDGGLVVSDLAVGQALSGGTIEGTGPHSWVDLKFNDGSSFRVFGNSMLTFSDDGQKVLRLRQGSFSADVKPQTAGKPMLVHTRTATLEVLGTEFEVAAELSSTALSVSEGTVRLRRASDGSSIDVPANGRVIAEADRDLEITSIDNSVHHWKSNLREGPDGAYGKWKPPGSDSEAQLLAIPYRTEKDKIVFAAAVQVSLAGSQPVTLHHDSLLRFRGNVRSAHFIFFGMTLKDDSGGFAGKFQVALPAEKLFSQAIALNQGANEFDVELPLHVFKLDPSLKHLASELPQDITGLIVESAWCHTLYDPVGLALAEVELTLEAVIDQL